MIRYLLMMFLVHVFADSKQETNLDSTVSVECYFCRVATVHSIINSHPCLFIAENVTLQRVDVMWNIDKDFLHSVVLHEEQSVDTWMRT